MDSKLYRIETYGMKNLTKKTEINFQPLTLAKGKLKKNISKIKAIYGSNGAGKTAVVQSLYFYKAILCDKDYLLQKDINEKLCNLINKITKEFYISTTFKSSYVEETELTQKHELYLSYDEEKEKVYIKKEKLSLLKGQTVNGECLDIFEVVDGELVFFENKYHELMHIIYDKTRNMLKSSSLISMMQSEELINLIKNYIDNYKSYPEQKLGKTIFSMLNTCFFANDLIIYLNNEDLKYNNLKINIDDLFEKVRENMNYFENKISSDEDLILKNNYDKYCVQINQMAKFIKIFKPELENIDIETKEDGHFLHCKKMMNYSNYRVDTAYESTGVRKLMKIYNSIESAVKGKIVFIDELDANISSVYLNKLLEYIQKEGEGQLCFTSHNILPMNYLYQLTQSIDFIGETGKVITWKKNGNYKPYNLYPEGMIEDSPFNIEYYDFMNVFNSDGDE